MLHTMTLTHTMGALVGYSLLFLFCNLAADDLYPTSGPRIAEQAYVTDTVSPERALGSE